MDQLGASFGTVGAGSEEPFAIRGSPSSIMEEIAIPSTGAGNPDKGFTVVEFRLGRFQFTTIDQN